MKRGCQCYAMITALFVAHFIVAIFNEGEIGVSTTMPTVPNLNLLLVRVISSRQYGGNAMKPRVWQDNQLNVNRAELLRRVQRRVQSVQMRCFVRTRARARGVACADRCKRQASLSSLLFFSLVFSSLLLWVSRTSYPTSPPLHTVTHLHPLCLPSPFSLFVSPSFLPQSLQLLQRCIFFIKDQGVHFRCMFLVMQGKCVA